MQIHTHVNRCHGQNQFCLTITENWQVDILMSKNHVLQILNNV